MSDRKDMELIAELVPKGSRVLDLGCGNGEFLALLPPEGAVPPWGGPAAARRSMPSRSCLPNFSFITSSDRYVMCPIMREMRRPRLGMTPCW